MKKVLLLVSIFQYASFDNLYGMRKEIFKYQKQDKAVMHPIDKYLNQSKDFIIQKNLEYVSSLDREEALKGIESLFVESFFSNNIPLLNKIINNSLFKEISTNKVEAGIFYSLKDKNKAIVLRLLEAVPLENYLQYSLFAASKYGCQDIVEYLLKKGINIHVSNSEGKTAFMIAAENGQNKILELLIDNVNVDRADKNFQTALFLASEKGHFNIVKKLLKQKPLIDKENINGYTPLFIASANGYYNVVKILLENNADVDHSSYKESTPLYVACQNGHKDIVELLLEYNADVNKPRRNLETPLMIAVRQNYKEIIKKLLRSPDIDIKKSNLYGQTAYDIAFNQNDLETASLLKFYKYMIDNRLTSLLFIDFEELEKKLPLNYMPNYFVLISENKKQAQWLFEKYIVQKNKNNQKDIAQDDRCLICLETKKEIEKNNEDIILFREPCCMQLVCSSCYFDFYTKTTNLDGCFICRNKK